MNPLTPKSSAVSTDDRLERIESVLAHLQHDVDSLNASLLNQYRRLQEFEARFVRLESELQVETDSADRRDASSERPPHY